MIDRLPLSDFTLNLVVLISPANKSLTVILDDTIDFKKALSITAVLALITRECMLSDVVTLFTIVSNVATLLSNTVILPLIDVKSVISALPMIA